uniref:Uncharacterized protein n=1 Tax=Sphaerodactylus townsendi TaxID=933632 RepID=A0ACB8F5N2_9SAUR
MLRIIGPAWTSVWVVDCDEKDNWHSNAWPGPASLKYEPRNILPKYFWSISFGKSKLPSSNLPMLLLRPIYICLFFSYKFCYVKSKTTALRSYGLVEIRLI